MAGGLFLEWTFLNTHALKEAPAMKTLTPSEAVTRVDNLIDAMVQHQPNLFRDGALSGSDSGKFAAQALASFRKTLIEELQRQPSGYPDESSY